MMQRSRFRAMAASIAIVAATPFAALAAEPTGFHAELLSDLERVEEKVVSLAEAIPAEDYDWRPAEGVRSVSEAFMHLAAANHRMLEAFGHTSPEGVGEMETITDKDQVVEALKASYAAVEETLRGLDPSVFDEQVEFFGRTWTKRQVAYLIATHGHEHLGQAIAYARSVGVTPPWSRPQEDDDESS